MDIRKYVVTYKETKRVIREITGAHQANKAEKIKKSNIPKETIYSEIYIYVDHTVQASTSTK